MATRFKDKAYVFLDSNGHARAGGLVNFYITGTTTRQNTYTDDALTTPNLNPIVLDGSGRSATDIFLLAADYKTVVTNSDATDSITDDPVHGSIVNSGFYIAGWIASGGTVDAITATYSPAILTLTDGMLLAFRATGANATTTPTFAPSGLTAHTIVKVGGHALAAGDIPRANYECFVRYNLANTRWELLNPTPYIGQVSATVSANSGVATGLVGASGISGLYIAWANLQGINDPANYFAWAVYGAAAGGTMVRLTGNNGSLMTMTVASNSITATQTSGAPQTIEFSVYKLAAFQ